MGIARGSLENLKNLNREVAKNGSARVAPAPQFGGSSAMRSGVGAPVSSVSTAPIGHSTALDMLPVERIIGLGIKMIQTGQAESAAPLF
jgi:hypothetical protein